MTLVIVAWHPLSDCKIQGVGLRHTPGVGASHSGSSAPSSLRTKPLSSRRWIPKRARSGRVAERLALSRCSRCGRVTAGGTRRTPPPRPPRGNAPVAHMVQKGVSAPNDTLPHNKETRHPRPPPRGAPRRPGGPRSAAHRPRAPRNRVSGAVPGRCRCAREGAGADPAGQRAAGQLGGARRARGDAASTEI